MTMNSTDAHNAINDKVNGNPLHKNGHKNVDGVDSGYWSNGSYNENAFDNGFYKGNMSNIDNDIKTYKETDPFYDLRFYGPNGPNIEKDFLSYQDGCSESNTASYNKDAFNNGYYASKAYKNDGSSTPSLTENNNIKSAEISWTTKNIDRLAIINAISSISNIQVSKKCDE